MKTIRICFLLLWSVTAAAQWQPVGSAYSGAVYHNGGNVGIGTSSPLNKLQIGPNSPGWNNNDLVVSNSWGALAIFNGDGETYLYGTQGISIRPGYGTYALFAAYNGYVGIRTATPQKPFEVKTGLNDFASIGESLGINDYSGLSFGYLEANNSLYRKSALVFQRVDGDARGKIHFLNNGANSSASATLTDSKMTIDHTGNIGIGNTSPNHRLDILSSDPNQIVKISVAGATSDYLRILNMTGAPGQFIPSIYGYHTTDNRQALYVTGVVDATNDTGNEPIVVFDARRSTAAAATRPLFAWDSYGARKMSLSATGNLGIGTSAPAEKLEVMANQASIRIGDNRDVTSFTTTMTEMGSLKFYHHYNTLIGAKIYTIKAFNGSPGMAWGGTDMRFAVSGVSNNSIFDAMTITHLGRVGIGTATPDEKLAVNGTVHAKEVRVDMTNWNDHVFNDSYRLRPLSEVQQFIQQHGHLPEVPSEKEVLANGQNLGEMNAVLLKKIEELTLYIIHHNRELEIERDAREELAEQLRALRVELSTLTKQTDKTK